MNNQTIIIVTLFILGFCLIIAALVFPTKKIDNRSSEKFELFCGNVKEVPLYLNDQDLITIRMGNNQDLVVDFRDPLNKSVPPPAGLLDLNKKGLKLTGSMDGFYTLNFENKMCKSNEFQYWYVIEKSILDTNSLLNVGSIIFALTGGFVISGLLASVNKSRLKRSLWTQIKNAKDYILIVALIVIMFLLTLLAIGLYTPTN